MYQSAWIYIALLVLLPVCASAQPVVIGHRGASGYRPEHTIESYALAIEQGADFIEPDLVMTKDCVLVCRHDCEISETTDVAAHPEFFDRLTTRWIDGAKVTGWFVQDFTFEELRTLRAIERIPRTRPHNVSWNGRFSVPSLQEVIDLVRAEKARTGRDIGIYPETKHSSYHRMIGLELERPLVSVLHANGYHSERDGVVIQSFEVANLMRLNAMTDLRLAQLISDSKTWRPYDFVLAQDSRTTQDLIAPSGLEFIRSYADIVAPNKFLVIPRTSTGQLESPTTLVQNARDAGLEVHIWTLRTEAEFTPKGLDAAAEFRAYVNAGIDGFFTDHPDAGRAAVDHARPSTP